MKRYEVAVGTSHDGELDFEIPGAVVINPWGGQHPHYANASELLNCYPEGSELHVAFRLKEDRKYPWEYVQEAWVEVP